MSNKIWKLTIVADENDADYVNESHSVSGEELERVNRIVAEIMQLSPTKDRFKWGKGELNNHRNDPYILYGDILTEEDIDWFDDLVPYGDDGVHTVDGITYTPLSSVYVIL